MIRHQVIVLKEKFSLSFPVLRFDFVRSFESLSDFNRIKPNHHHLETKSIRWHKSSQEITHFLVKLALTYILLSLVEKNQRKKEKFILII